VGAVARMRIMTHESLSVMILPDRITEEIYHGAFVSHTPSA
jgi:hypothetical protein